MVKNEPGRVSRTTGHYDPGMLAGVNSVEEFAHTLKVPEQSIALIIPTNDNCKIEECPFNAIANNEGCCPLHKRTWYPLLTQRGNKLLGPEFLRGTSGKLRVCDCKQKACKAAGYFPNQGALYISSSGHETLLSQTGLLSKKAKEKVKKKKKVYLYPWHFFPQHLEKGKDGKWKLKYKKKANLIYRDLEKKRSYSYPPPRQCVNTFINNNILTSEYVRPQMRWAQENNVSKMPTWLLSILAIDSQMDISEQANDKPQKKVQRDPYRNAEMWEARARYLHQQMSAQAKKHSSTLKELVERHSNEIINQANNYKQQLSDTKKKYEEIYHENKQQKEKIINLTNENKELQQQLEESRRLLEELRSKAARPLRYEDLRSGGILSKHVNAFTLFDTVEQNDAFLGIVNYADGTPGSYPAGDGLCENLRPYSKVTRDERSGKVQPPSIDMDSKEYREYINRVKGQGNILYLFVES